MRVVATLLARDEADVVDAQVAFHLAAGADFVIATDNGSKDGTTEILEAYERAGVLHLIREPAHDRRHGEWFTRMARLAATEFGADWIVNTDADEFWWPRGGSLKDVLAAIPPRYGIVGALVRHFPPRPDDGAFFAERMTVRLSPRAAVNDPSSSFRPYVKMIHRPDAGATVEPGNHGLDGSSLRRLRAWYPVEVLHFPLRSREQAERKSVKWIENTRPPAGAARIHEGKPNAYHERGYAAHLAGRFDDYYASQCVDEEALARGLDEGSLAFDTRLRDALRALGAPDFGKSSGAALPFPLPDVVDEAAYAVDVAVLGEANLVRLQRRLDGFEERLSRVEGGTFQRMRRLLYRLVPRR